MKFEKLNSLKFEMDVLSKDEMLNVSGGKTYPTNYSAGDKKGYDFQNFHCTGNLYDMDSTYDDKSTDTQAHDKATPGVSYDRD